MGQERIPAFLIFSKYGKCPMKNENGIATILAIGITALLLCLGIAYVTTSIVEKKASSNYQNIVSARVAAQTAFNRAVALMKSASTNPQESFSNIVSHRSDMTSWTNADTESLASKLTTVINGITYYSLPVDYPSGCIASDTTNVSWIYFRTNQADTGTIIGRIAYVVVPDKGKIDPWAVIDSGVNADSWGITPPSEFNYGGGNTSVDTAGNYVVGRPGRDLTELSLASLQADTTAFSAIYTQKMSAATCSPPGLVPIGNAGNWKDYEKIFNALGIAANNDTTRDYFRKVFYVNALEDPEAFWVDVSDDNIRDTNEFYHRFNLTRTDWDTLTVNSIGNASGIKFMTALSGESNYLPWLGDNGWKSSGGFANKGVAQSQIIANLIDYCDSNDIPTTDSGTNTDPTYIGLEKVPYINRVMVSITGKIVVATNGLSGGSRRYIYTFTTENIADTVQVVDMYGVSKSIQAKVDMEDIELQWGKFSSPTLITTLDSESFEIMSSPFTTSAAPTSNGYSNTTLSILPTINYTLQRDAVRTLTTTTSSSYADTRIMARINSLKVRLFGAGTADLYDYSFIFDNNTTWYPVVSNASSTSSTPTTGTLIFVYETNDPRQNTLTSDWSLKTYTTTSSTPPPSLTANNTVFAPNPGGSTDPEPSATYPYLISTAYIRNAPMKSPWELGLIHRAKAFQTLNLKKYNTTEGVNVGAGGNNYDDGDANILDQVKMTSRTTTLGKINLNSDNQSVLRTLFDNIKIGSSKDNPGSGGTATSVTTANTIANNIIAVNGSQGTGTAFTTRANTLNNTTVANLLTTGTTDATKEEFIGKFINLTKAESPEEYTVIAVGEAIRDIGGTRFDRYGKSLSTPTDTSVYDPNADEILASQKILAIIKRDFTTSPSKFYVKRFIYLSD